MSSSSNGDGLTPSTAQKDFILPPSKPEKKRQASKACDFFTRVRRNGLESEK
jgi:hypothetical protein